MLYQVLPVAAFFGLALAAPTEEAQCPLTICVDAINTCGVRYGGCYDSCNSALRPTAPACVTSVSSTTTEDCSTRTVCADYVNECGMMYGGCFADCTPWPTFTAPPCTGTYTSAAVTTTIPPSITTIPLPEATDCSTQTVCEDYINECGQTYGGCHPACTPWPTYTAPPCADTTTKKCNSVTTVAPPSTTVTTICADYLKTCTEDGTTQVLTYGGCYTVPGPTPTFSEPSCPTPTVTSDTYPTKA